MIIYIMAVKHKLCIMLTENDYESISNLIQFSSIAEELLLAIQGNTITMCMHYYAVSSSL